MELNFNDLDKKEAYNWLVGSVMPRPIAWVLTRNENQTYNLAPFSYFNIVSSDPAILSISIGDRRDGGPKDTKANILREKQLVIHIPSASDAVEVTQTAAPLAVGESEIRQSGLEVVNQPGFDLPVLAKSPLYFRCELFEFLEIGPNKQGLVLVEVKTMHIDDALLTSSGRINPKALAPLSRLGGDDYGLLGGIETIERER